MKEFRDDQRHSLEEAQEEAWILKLMIELGEYGCQNYVEAEFYLPDFQIESEIVSSGQMTKLEAYRLDMDWEDPNNPIKDSEWVTDDGPLARCGEFNCVECDNCQEEINSERCIKCPVRWLF